MSQIMKTFLGTFMIMLLTVTASGILSGFLTVIEAQNIHSQMISELEDSDFYPGVVRSCFESAKSLGDELNITFYMDDNTIRTVSNINGIPDTSSVVKARVELRFLYTIAFFGISQEHVLSGYAL